MLYAFVLLLCVVATYNAVNAALLAVTGAPRDTVPLGVEPLLFGAFTMGWDMLFLFFRHTARRVVAEEKKRAGS